MCYLDVVCIAFFSDELMVRRGVAAFVPAKVWKMKVYTFVKLRYLA